MTGRSRRRFLRGASAAGAAALAGCVGGFGGGGGTNGGNGGGDGGDGAANPVASAPVPPSPGDHEYAVMGTGDASLTVTYYGSWKCPYCAQFDTGFLGDLVTDYVQPGKMALRFRALTYTTKGPFLGPDAPNASRAGLAVWNAEPDAYWAFHHHVFANQPPEKQEWATADKLVSFAEAAGVEQTDAIRSAIDGNQYEGLLQRTSQDAGRAGVTGTPTLVVKGQAVSPFKQEQTRKLIEDAL